MTSKLAGNMALAQRLSRENIRALRFASKVAARRYDIAGKQIAELEAQSRKDPNNDELTDKIEALMEVRRGLIAAAGYADGAIHLETGKPNIRKTPDHQIKNQHGKFAQKGSYGHFLGRLKQVLTPKLPGDE
jgi:hypothetical protein